MIHQRNTANSMNTHPSVPESKVCVRLGTVDAHPAKSAAWDAHSSSSFPPKKGTPSKHQRSDDEGVLGMLRGIPPPPLGVYLCGDRSDEPADATSPCGRVGGRGSTIATALSMGLAFIALVLTAADRRMSSASSSMSDQIIRLTDELSTLRSIETGLTLDLDEEKKHSRELSVREEEERQLLHDRDVELEKRRKEYSRGLSLREDEERVLLRAKERELEHLRSQLMVAKAMLERESRGGKVRGAKQKEADEEADDESDYALLFPNADCLGTPIRIDYSSSEENCDHCRDFCSLTFSEAQEEGGRTATTANLANQTSMLAVGSRSVEIVHMCLGQFAYEKVDITLNVLTPGEGCANLGEGAAHARFM